MAAWRRFAVCKRFLVAAVTVHAAIVKNFADLNSSFKGLLSGHGLLCRHASEEGW